MRPIPYQEIAAMVDGGASYCDIAARFPNLVLEGEDRNHYLRAILHRMRSHGYVDKNGKRVKLQTKPSRSRKVMTASQQIAEGDLIMPPSALKYRQEELFTLVNMGGKTIMLARRGRNLARVVAPGYMTSAASIIRLTPSQLNPKEVVTLVSLARKTLLITRRGVPLMKIIPV